MRIVIADDEMLIRDGLSRLLSEIGFEVVASAATPDDALRKVQAHKPDVLVTDIRMPPRLADEGIVLAETLHATHPEIGVVVLTQHLESHYAMRLLRQRTRGIGYLLKSRIGDIDVLGGAIRRVGLGGAAVDPQVVDLLLNRKRTDDPLAQFTARERETLGLMAEGYSNQGIAERLVLSMKTVESHVRQIYIKLNLTPARDDSRRVLAVLSYLRSTPEPEGASA